MFHWKVSVYRSTDFIWIFWHFLNTTDCDLLCVSNAKITYWNVFDKRVSQPCDTHNFRTNIEMCIANWKQRGVELTKPTLGEVMPSLFIPWWWSGKSKEPSMTLWTPDQPRERARPGPSPSFTSWMWASCFYYGLKTTVGVLIISYKNK